MSSPIATRSRFTVRYTCGSVKVRSSLVRATDANHARELFATVNPLACIVSVNPVAPSAGTDYGALWRNYRIDV